MNPTTIADLKALFPLSLEDEQIQAHLNRSIWDFNDVEFKDEIQALEVIGSKALFYLAPLLWVNMQNRASEYEESLETFKDVHSFEQYWLNRSNSALNRFDEIKTSEDGEISWLAI